MGMLRLYPKGETTEGVIDIVPRLGRAVLFKSEVMLHKMRDTLEWNNNVLTIYFNQVVSKPKKPHPIPETWSMFIGIASYRDPQLIHTMKSMISMAKYPERLRLVIYNQYDFWNEWD